MKGARRLPIYFSIAAFIVSVFVCVIKGISPVAALQRIAASVVLFFMLGYCTCLFPRIRKETRKPSRHS